MMFMEQLSSLISRCDEDERELIERMVLSASDYVRAVIYMKARALNYAGRSGEELRSAVEQADQERTICHNALISYVDIVNRICNLHELPPLYSGGTARREYGDFAILLVSEIFEQR